MIKKTLIILFVTMLSFNMYAKSNIYTCKPLPYEDINYYASHPFVKAYINQLKDTHKDVTLDSITSFIGDQSFVLQLKYLEGLTSTSIQFFDENGDGNMYTAGKIIDNNILKLVQFSNVFILSWYENKIMLLGFNRVKITPFICI